MKSCPTCNRTYDDDSLSFCLEDGARLIATHRANVPSSSFDISDPAQTAILPPHRRPTGETVAAQPTIAAVAAGGYARPTTPNEGVKGGSNKYWLIFGGVFLLVLAGLIVVFAFLALTGNDKRLAAEIAPSPSPTGDVSVSSNDNTQSNGNAKINVTVQPNSNPETNSNVQANANISVIANPPTESKSPDDNLNWLEGEWAGEGYQSDTRTTWTVRLSVRNGSFAIEYPNIPCSGSWNLTNKHSRGASFTEYITQGTDRCVQNERVMIEKVSDSEISCKYVHAGSREVVATAVLTKKAP